MKKQNPQGDPELPRARSQDRLLVPRRELGPRKKLVGKQCRPTSQNLGSHERQAW